MLSISSERPLDPMAVEILRVVQHVIAARGLSCIVVGATARDILLTCPRAAGHPRDPGH